jgi:hypothetical protein
MIGFDIESQRNGAKRRFHDGHLLEALALSKGLNIRSIGKGRIFRVLPPLSISRDEIDRALSILDECLTDIEADTVDEQLCILTTGSVGVCSRRQCMARACSTAQYTRA